jgi:hypothetical protein
MHRLSDIFIKDLKIGFLKNITQTVQNDPDLNLEIRNKSINIYYKGNSLLRLTDVGDNKYRVDIHEKFTKGLDIPTHLSNFKKADMFIKNIPLIKQKIVDIKKKSLEIEYEQLIVRANNFEYKNNSDYFIIDRQYVEGEGRFDLTGIYWDSTTHKKNQEVPLCFIEVKFALNQDISIVHEQIEKYYKAIELKPNAIAEEIEGIFHQKLDLGLYVQPRERIEAMKTLKIIRDIKKFQFIIIFIDYNPNSTMLNLKALKNLSFSSQVKVFKAGFALWDQNEIMNYGI